MSTRRDRESLMCVCFDFAGDNTDCVVHPPKTDDGAVTSPATPRAAHDPAAQAGDQVPGPVVAHPREPRRDRLLVDRDNDVYRYEENAWLCLTESNFGSWSEISRLYGPLRVYAPQTDDGAVSPPADPTGVAPPTAAERATSKAAPSSPRMFVLYRHVDHSGVSGTGVVAEGIQWSDGAVTVRWFGEHPSTAVWDSVDAVMAVHGHEGDTELRWLDGDES